MFSTFAKDSWAGHARVSFITSSFFFNKEKMYEIKKPLLKFVSLSWVIFLKFDDGDGSNLCRVKPFVGYQ